MQLSVVIPAYNEALNLSHLVDEIVASLTGIDYEIIIVNDGSNDHSAALLADLKDKLSQLKVVEHQASVGQSYALISGVNCAGADVIATLDGDGQNNPADIITLYHYYQDKNVQLVMGHRIKRQDSMVKKISSVVSNKVRAYLLKDNIADSGCGIKVFDKKIFLSLPHFHHIHRYLPALFKREGAAVLSHPVSHRERRFGESKYGIHNRLWGGLIDLFMVYWLIKRKKKPVIVNDK